MTQSLASIVRKPSVDTSYPKYDAVGNKFQRITLHYACGHDETYDSLDMGKGWKPRSKTQILRDELVRTCPASYVMCHACSAGAEWQS